MLKQHTATATASVEVEEIEDDERRNHLGFNSQRIE